MVPFASKMLSQVENPVQLCWGLYSLCSYWVPAGCSGVQCLQIHKLTNLQVHAFSLHHPSPFLKPRSHFSRLMGVAGLANQSWTPNTIDTIVVSYFQLWPDESTWYDSEPGTGCFGRVHLAARYRPVILFSPSLIKIYAVVKRYAYMMLMIDGYLCK